MDITRSLAAFAAALFIPLAACQHLTETARFANGAEDGAARRVLTSQLGQSVTLTPASPRSGEDVTVRSVLVNIGREPLTLESRMCGLDYAGTLRLTNPPEVLKCAAYSQAGLILPGDSVVTSDIMRVSSGAGSYELRVRHALAPEGWISVPVTVR